MLYTDPKSGASLMVKDVNGATKLVRSVITPMHAFGYMFLNKKSVTKNTFSLVLSM